jgi:signal transduction histidine kinase
MPNSRFQRWNVTSEMFFSLHSSAMVHSPVSASRKIRIFSSVLYFLPFMSGSLLAQTNAQGGLIFRGHVRADVLVKFVDHGIGIPPSILSGLFDIGHNVSRPGTAGEKGTGYGMPLLRRFVEIYGGDVDVQSRDREVDPSDSGTIFTIRLNLAPHSH